MAVKTKLVDTFAGYLELTAVELGYLRRVLQDHYMRGGWCPEVKNKRDFMRGVVEKVGALKLHRMVTPDGSRLVSIAEHDAIVAKSQCYVCQGSGEVEIYPWVDAPCPTCNGTGTTPPLPDTET